jgi:uncharacterized protein YdaU (DUF1376 family)
MSRPWMPLYVADYLADTAHLNATESGAYLHLIMHYWLNGGLPDCDRQLSRIARMTARQWVAARDTLRSFFYDGWRHARIDREIAKSAEISAKRKTAGGTGHSKSEANDEQLPTHARASSPSQSQSQSPSQRQNKKDAADAASSLKLVEPPPTPTVEYFRFAERVIGPKSGYPARMLLQAKGGNLALARAALEQASQAANAREYVWGILRKAEYAPGGEQLIDPRLG